MLLEGLQLNLITEEFHQEMDTVSKSSIKMLLDDRITDDQFEKLLKRRDNLIERSEKQNKPPSPQAPPPPAIL
jgi:hypothetical protein